MPNQADYLDEEIKRLEAENPDSKMLGFLRTQRNYLRRIQRQFSGEERERPNPCGR